MLGSTGSIGRQALDVLAGLPDRFSVTALAAGRDESTLNEQVARFRPRLTALAKDGPARARGNGDQRRRGSRAGRHDRRCREPLARPSPRSSAARWSPRPTRRRSSPAAISSCRSHAELAASDGDRGPGYRCPQLAATHRQRALGHLAVPGRREARDVRAADPDRVRRSVPRVVGRAASLSVTPRKRWRTRPGAWAARSRSTRRP